VDATSSGATVSEVLDPVLVPRGFAAGQYGEGTACQVIFCASFDDFRERYPHLPQALQEDGGVGACVDLVIDVDRDRRICRLELEAYPMDETLRSVGLGAEADDLVESLAHTLELQLKGLRAVLLSLFESPR
jgi:hypothetical protein